MSIPEIAGLVTIIGTPIAVANIIIGWIVHARRGRARSVQQSLSIGQEERATPKRQLVWYDSLILLAAWFGVFILFAAFYDSATNTPIAGFDGPMSPLFAFLEFGTAGTIIAIVMLFRFLQYFDHDPKTATILKDPKEQLKRGCAIGITMMLVMAFIVFDPFGWLAILNE